MSKFKQFHTELTPVDELGGAITIKERVIDNTAVARLSRINNLKTQYPYIVEVVRKYSKDNDGDVNYKSQDFKTQQEAERFLDRII